MRSRSRGIAVAAWLMLLSCLGPAAADEARWIEGRLLLAWGTADAGRSAPGLLAASLELADGSLLPLDLGPHQLAVLGGPTAADRARVLVLLPGEIGTSGPITPLEVKLAGGAPPPTEATGSYPYVSLMCAFSDVALPPEGLGYFQDMYANVMPGLDHYWRSQSYDRVDVVGSTAAGWFILPHTQSHYTDMIVGTNYSTMLTALYTDCTDAASGSVTLSDFVGINLMFNDTFGPYAWGGWGGVTWEPPWGWRNIAVIGHEMGHAFGLPHSNNADGDSSPYDNPWDVMSDSWGHALSDPTYGTVGKHTIAYHKNLLDWIAPARRATVSSPGFFTFDVDHLTLAGTTNLHLVMVEIPGSASFYTVEVRDRSGYDGNLPGFAVILHQVDPTRQEPAWLVDLENPDNGADAGAMWLPGECFDDAVNEILICVDSVITEGYRVEIGTGDGYFVFRDGFESGATGGWSSTVP